LLGVMAATALVWLRGRCGAFCTTGEFGGLADAARELLSLSILFSVAGAVFGFQLGTAIARHQRPS
jgi:hypothetical protein